MRAVLSVEPGGPDSLVIDELPSPEPGEGQVVLDVKAVGINYPDVLIIQDLYQFRPDRPFAPGGEVAGVVSAVGAGVTATSSATLRGHPVFWQTCATVTPGCVAVSIISQLAESKRPAAYEDV